VRTIPIIAVFAVATLLACGDDQTVSEAPDLSRPEPDASGDIADADVAILDASEDLELEPDLALDPDADTDSDAVPDVVATDIEGVFPGQPEDPCLEGGDGARGVISFAGEQPLIGATVALVGVDFKHLGVTDGDGAYYVRVPDCAVHDVLVARYDSTAYPSQPSLVDLPLGEADPLEEEPEWEIPLVRVEGTIVDVLSAPISGALLEAELLDGRVRVYNEHAADDVGAFGVYLVPWSDAPYDMTARGPQGGDKTYRTATLRILIEDPPPEPSVFTLFEERCPVAGPIRTSEGIPLNWLYMTVEGEPYPDGLTYLSFDPGFYYERDEPDVVTESLPLQCGTQRVRLWNAIWTDPNWPCIDERSPDQLCINGYPLLWDETVTEASDGFEIPVVRVSGEITDEMDVLLSDVTVRFEARYRWGEGAFDTVTVFNEAVTDDGYYSMVLLAYPDIVYDVTARIRDDDPRPLGEFEGVAAVSEATAFDIEMPEAPPRCVLTGTVHSSEGRAFSEILTSWRGNDFESGESLYVDPPLNFFSPEPETWHRDGFPDESIPFVPLFCGEHDLELHSVDWPSCYLSPDEVCFSLFPWWNNEPIEEPLSDGLEIPVVHLSGFVRGPDSEPVEGVAVSATYQVGFFNFAQNANGTDATGLYDFVVLPDTPWSVAVSIADDHPQVDDYWAPEPVTIESGPTGTALSIELLEGPDRCRLGGEVVTSDGVPLERLILLHYGPWYGLLGWEFWSDEPGAYYRRGNETTVLDAIPLVCGEQDLRLLSRRSSFNPSCFNDERFDQPCLSNYAVWQGVDMSDDVDGVEIPVVTISGRVTLDGTDPIEGARVEASGTVFRAGAGPDDPPVRVGGVSNHAVTRTDGTYDLVVVPTEFSDYTITITTPIAIDLGQITATETITDDTEVDADFSSEE